MEKLSKYIQELEFEYAISYSGLRGEKFTSLERNNRIEIQRIEEAIKTARFMQVPKLKKQIEILEGEIDIYNARIIHQDGEFHKSCKLIHRFEKGDVNLNAIVRILQIESNGQVIAMCLPVFRDAIVFYSKEDEIKGILQICFGCLQMETANGLELEADIHIYEDLKAKLIELGHQIESK